MKLNVLTNTLKLRKIKGGGNFEKAKLKSTND